MTVRITRRPADGAAHVTVSAPDLTLANHTMAAMSAEAHYAWPSDVRFAAPPEAVVGVSDALPGLDRVMATLTDAGARAMAVDAEAVLRSGWLPDDADAVVLQTDVVDDPGDLCAVTVAEVTVLARPFDDAVALDIAALISNVDAPQDVWPLTVADHTELVVFGAHLRGGPLAHQLTDLGARWAGELTTAPRYRMTVLPTAPPKPAVTRVPDGATGVALHGHRWLLSPAALGRFLAALPAPMQLGKVEFGDGTWRTAFGCDGSAATGKDISSYGSWPAAIAAGVV
jgi:allophanate hydrolase